MKKVFDEISLEYWDLHKKKTGLSKSFTCLHNGHIYGDNMTFDGIKFVYKIDNKVKRDPEVRNEAKYAYFDFVQASCNMSDITLKNFLTNKSQKYRIYTKDQVSLFKPKQVKSTRIKDQSCEIKVSGESYFVANNLKICEYFNNASSNIDPDEKGNWFIQIYFQNKTTQRIIDQEEQEDFDFDNSGLSYKITEIPCSALIPAANSGQKHKENSETNLKINYDRLNKIKKKIGELGELIVLEYEYERLAKKGKKKLADSIEHTSIEKGDGCGYDIKSFMDDGSPLYIEVKATKYNKMDDFYISENERIIGNQMYSEGKKYKIYRAYNIDTYKGTGNLTIFEPPFDSKHYCMESENWRIQLKK